MNDLIEPRIATVEPAVTERDRARLAELLQPKKQTCMLLTTAAAAAAAAL